VITLIIRSHKHR